MEQALTADRIIVGSERVPEEGYIIVDGALIVDRTRSAPTSVPVHSFAGATLMPGMIDCHTHLSIVPSLGDQLGQMRQPLANKLGTGRSNVLSDLLAGITTARVMGEEHGLDFALSAAIKTGRLPGPSLVVSGVQLTKPGAHGHAETSVSTSEEIERLIADNAAKGAGLIKTFATGGVSSADSAADDAPFSLDELSHIVACARRNDLPVAAHAVRGPGIDLAIEAEVDSIEHGSVLDDEQIKRILACGIPVVGTFAVLFHPLGIEAGDSERPAIVEKAIEARAQVVDTWRRVVGSGIAIGLGTDSMHGCLAFEAAKLVEFGADPMRAIAAVTSEAARICRTPDRGVLDPGCRADIIAVAGNPAEDIRALAAPIMVMKGGAFVSRFP